MRHRGTHHAPPIEDPFQIFESPSDLNGRIKSSKSPLNLKCCHRRNARNWLTYCWLFLMIVMGVIAWKIFVLYVELPAAPSDTFLSVFFPIAWKLKRSPKRGANQDTKKIFYYNQFWNFPHFNFGEHHRPFVDAGCPVHDCVAVQNQPSFTAEYLRTFDAILFHGPELSDVDTLLTDTAKWRQPHQRFIYMNMESPLSYNSPADRRLNDFFNWTMTYRLDSDLPRPYGFFEFQPRGKTLFEPRYKPYQWTEQPFFKFHHDLWISKALPTKDEAFHQLANRTQKVAWIVSRCDSPSRREDYVKELKKHIPVTIFGNCGDIPCNTSFHSHSSSVDNCTVAVDQDYKFYLSFENSFCNDYVTEKFFRRLQGNSLVVVLGGANYSRIAPPHSHLNALDYESPQALAQKLHQLDRNDTLYLSYFWWKDFYRVHNGTAEDHASTMCKLCKMLHDPTLPWKSYPSIASWHGPASQCREPLPDVILNLPRKVGGEDDGNLLDDGFK